MGHGKKNLYSFWVYLMVEATPLAYAHTPVTRISGSPDAEHLHVFGAGGRVTRKAPHRDLGGDILGTDRWYAPYAPYRYAGR